MGIVASFIIALIYAVVLFIAYMKGAFRKRPDDGSGKPNIVMYIAVSFTISISLSLVVFGHSTDMTDFSLWSIQLAKVGIPDFYTWGMWTDYPPGIFYPLYLIGLLGKLFGIGFGQPLFNMMIKLPAIIADAACAYIIYRIAKKSIGDRSAANLAGVFAFCPAIIIDSAIWGQIDSILALLAFGSIWFYMKNKKELCALLYVVGLLVKPQMLLFAPILFIAFIRDIFTRNWKSELWHIFLSVLVGLSTAILIALPFSLNQSPDWLIKMYMNTTTSYPYASVNAYNLYALLGANWSKDTMSFILGLSYKDFGTICIVIICAASGIYYIISRKRKAIFPAAALLIWGIFAFAHNMHERYLFPVLILLVVSFVLYNDKRFLVGFGFAAAVIIVNCIACLEVGSVYNGWFMAPTAIINMIGFGYTAYACFAQLKRKDQEIDAQPVQTSIFDEHEPEQQDTYENTVFSLTARDRKGERIVRIDYILMAVITVLYGIIAMINLGSVHVPSSYWRPMEIDEGMVADLGSVKEISSIYYYAGVSGDGRVEVSLSEDGHIYDEVYIIDLKQGEMYKWKSLEIPGSARYIKLVNKTKAVNLLEAGIYDKNNNLIEIKKVTPLPGEQSSDPSAVFDEQNLIDESPTYLTEMYFDEIYHARTAFEHLNGIRPYENTHPPLGKVFIMTGIYLFGMNPFGWRIIGTLFGIAMLPIIYVFAKRLFRNTKCAVAACLLMALDGMHFAQTRIATIDVYGVFFIILMCYFMYRYWCMNFYIDKLGKTFVPLGLSGVMFGLGVASKWIGMYAGVGLAVAFFSVIAKRYLEYRHAKARLKAAEGDELAICQKVTETFTLNTLKTLLFCVGFFIIIPILIYLASYLPYFLCKEYPYDLKGVIGIQEYMYDYHSNLKATHGFQSDWYTWPVILRPIWYFQGKNVDAGNMSSIASFGNPAVWWTGLIAVFAVIYKLIKKDKHTDSSSITFILICLGAAYLPWVLISRCTFIYHYFASVPFIILLTVYMFRKKDGKLSRWAWVVVAIAAALFILFYPVWSGWEINREYALTYLRWFNTWWFF